VVAFVLLVLQLRRNLWLQFNHGRQLFDSNDFHQPSRRQWFCKPSASARDWVRRTSRSHVQIHERSWLQQHRTSILPGARMSPSAAVSTGEPHMNSPNPPFAAEQIHNPKSEGFVHNRRSALANIIFSCAYRRFSFPSFRNCLIPIPFRKPPRAAGVAAIWIRRTFRASLAASQRTYCSPGRAIPSCRDCKVNSVPCPVCTCPIMQPPIKHRDTRWRDSVLECARAAPLFPRRSPSSSHSPSPSEAFDPINILIFIFTPVILNTAGRTMAVQTQTQNTHLIGNSGN